MDHITGKVRNIKATKDLSSLTLKLGKHEMIIFQLIKLNNYQQRLLYPEKLEFMETKKMSREAQIKAAHDTQTDIAENN